MTKALKNADYDQAESALIKQDPVLGILILKQRPIIRASRGDYFTSLCRSIVGQQVSVASATAIFNRLVAETGLDYPAIQNLTQEQIKLIGLSKQKVSYLQDLARHFLIDPKIYDHLSELSDEAVIADLTTIKGIGVWTAQMFLMFTLTRPDVFAVDDVGLQNAMMQLYKWPELPPKQTLIAKAEIWRPYRTVASWHLWQSLK